MPLPSLEFSAELQSTFIEEGFDPAYFVILPEAIAAEIAAQTAGSGRAFGSVKVSVSIGRSSWNTTLLRRDGRYVLPIRKPVRVAEGLREGERVAVTISVL